MITVIKEGANSVISLPDRFSSKPAQELFEFLGLEGYRTYPDLILDFDATEFIDSTAIGVLVSLSKSYRSSGAQLLLRNLSDHITELFSDTGLEMLFTVVSRETVRKASIDIFEENADVRLEIEIERKNEVCIFHLNGVMNHPLGSRYFKQQFLLALASSRKILLDFTGLTFFDSLSISVVLSMNKLIRETGGSLRFAGANYIVADLFSTLNIEQLIPIFNTVEEALVDW